MKILIIHTAFIGDIILSTALIEAIKIRYPEAEIHYLTQPNCKILLSNNPLVEKIITYDKNKTQKGFKWFLNIVKTVKAENYTHAIIPHRYIRSISIAKFAGIKNRIGFDISTGAFMLTKKVRYGAKIHEVDRLLSLIDFDNKDKTVMPRLYPSSDDNNHVEEILQKQKVVKHFEKLIVVAPGSKWFTKMWLAENYAQLIEKLSNHPDVLIAITGSEQEKEIDLKINDKTNVLDLRGKINLVQFAALVSKSDILVSNDSSPIHVGSAFENVYIVGIYGPTVEKLGFFPYSDNSIVIEDNTLSCRPCGKHGHNACPQKHFKCMRNISVEQVYDVVNNKLKSL
ncbi:MAG: glycosyltransferase family 9 protein [Lentimicrobiaceae bacterium]|nr:glycosyltransferase family 9 protein [Lentimicrobiaceae bacterium]